MIAVETDTEGWPANTDWAALARDGVRGAIAHSPMRGLLAAPVRAEISVRFGSDDEVRALNRDYRQKDRATNVLSFPMVRPETLDAIIRDAREGELLLGDVALAYGVCAAEAADKGITVAAHATHLVVHGAFHLIGYDHLSDADADEMEAAEREALASLGIADPYMDTR